LMPLSFCIWRALIPGFRSRFLLFWGSFSLYLRQISLFTGPTAPGALFSFFHLFLDRDRCAASTSPWFVFVTLPQRAFELFVLFRVPFLDDGFDLPATTPRPPPGRFLFSAFLPSEAGPSPHSCCYRLSFLLFARLALTFVVKDLDLFRRRECSVFFPRGLGYKLLQENSPLRSRLTMRCCFSWVPVGPVPPPHLGFFARRCSAPSFPASFCSVSFVPLVGRLSKFPSNGEEPQGV